MPDIRSLYPSIENDSISAHATVVGRRLTALTVDGFSPLDRRLAKGLARAMAYLTWQEVGSEQRVFEPRLGARVTWFEESAETVCRGRAANGLLLAGWCYLRLTECGTREPNQAELADEFDRITFCEVDPSWQRAWDVLQRDVGQAQPVLRAAAQETLRARGADPGPLNREVDDIVEHALRAWGSAFAPGDASTLKQQVCDRLWSSAVHTYLETRPIRELQRWAGRTLSSRQGADGDEVSQLKAKLWELRHLLHLQDDTWFGLVGSTVQSLQVKETPVEFEPDDDGEDEGGGRYAPEDDAEILQSSMRDARNHLLYALRVVRTSLENGEAPQRRSVEILDAVSAHDGRGFHDAVHGILQPNDNAPRPLNRKQMTDASVAVNRAYSHLRAELAMHDFLMFKDGEPDKPDDVRLALAGDARGLQHSVEADAWALHDVTRASREALQLELDGHPGGAVFRSFARLAEDPSGAAALLRQTRRKTRTVLGTHDERLRFLFEPPIEPQTRIATALRKLGFRSGRVIGVVCGPDGFPIQRAHDEPQLADVLPRLPQPLDRPSMGRWWYVRDARVGFAPMTEGEH